ncbi:MAG: hypothetical protein RR069_04600 [Oscillospiraceae bacterium]
MPDTKPKKSESESADEIKKPKKTTTSAEKKPTKTTTSAEKKPTKTTTSADKKATKEKTKTASKTKKAQSPEPKGEAAKKQTTKKEQKSELDAKAPKQTAKKQAPKKTKTPDFEDKAQVKTEAKNKKEVKEPAKKKAKPIEQEAKSSEAKTIIEEEAERVFVERDEEVISNELENIKSIVQNEVDKILDDPEMIEWKDLVKSAHQEKLLAKQNANSEQKEKNLCECCGENPKDTSVSPSSPYCEKCRESMKRYPFSLSEIVMPIIIVALLFLASWNLSQNFLTFSSLAKAQNLVKDGKLYSAVKAYDEIETQLKVNQKPVGDKIRENQIALYSKIGFEYYEQTEKFVAKYYAGKDLNSFANRNVKKAMDNITNFHTAYNAVGELITSSKDYEDFVKSFDAAIKKDDKNFYDKGLVEYWKYYAAIVFNKDTKVQLAHLKKMESLSPQYASIYQPALAELYLNMGKFDKMNEYCQLISKSNSEDIYANIYRSIAFRLKGDIVKAAKYANDGLKTNPEDPDINHQLSIISLLQGQPKAAFKFAESAYQNATSQYTYTTNANVYALCAHLNKDSKTYEAIEKELTDGGSGISKDVIAIIDGTKTIEDVFLKGKGDILWK